MCRALRLRRDFGAMRNENTTFYTFYAQYGLVHRDPYGLDLASDVGWAKVGKIKSHLWDFLGGILVKFDEKCGKIWLKSHV